MNAETLHATSVRLGETLHATSVRSIVEPSKFCFLVRSCLPMVGFVESYVNGVVFLSGPANSPGQRRLGYRLGPVRLGCGGVRFPG